MTDGSFMRKGEVGSWKEDFKNIPEIERELESWIQNQLEKTNIRFPTSFRKYYFERIFLCSK